MEISQQLKPSLKLNLEHLLIQIGIKKKGVSKINSLFFSTVFLFALNTTYFCDNIKLDLVIRNNINGDFSIVKTISEIEPGAFINIDWDDKKLMLPYSLRKDYLSFTDRKWDWRYQINQEGLVKEKNPILYELLPSGVIKDHICQLGET